MKLIVGLGNPGEKYKGIRHNLGFELVDKYVSSVMDHVSWEEEKKFKSQIIQINYTLVAKPYTLILAKPQTFMNKSGLAVSTLVNYYKINPEDVVIIHDELDLPLGKIKVRIGGAAAGHHGVESVIEALRTDKFIRIRLGIGQNVSTERFILEPFLHSEKSQVKHMIKQAVKALEILLDKGLDYAQNQFN